MTDLRIGIDSSLGEIFAIILDKAFAALAVLILADLLQLSPVREKNSYFHDSMKHFLGLLLYHLFRYAELTKVLSEMMYKLFIDLLNKVRVGEINNDVERLLKTEFIHESNENYANDTLHMYAENECAMKNNDLVLNDLPGEVYKIEADEKFQIIVNTSWQQLKLLRVKNKQTRVV